jgi:Flp pilus assembly protein TadD
MAPGFALAHRSLGIVFFDQGATDKALGHFDEAARLYPGDAETHLRRGMALLKQNDKAGARAAFETAWKLTPRSDLGKSAKTYLDLLQ